MKNIEAWKPSKFIYDSKGRLKGSRDPAEVGYGSRLMCDLVAKYYDIYLQQYASGQLLDLGCGKVPLYHAYRDLVSESTCADWENTLHKNNFLDFYCDLTQDLDIGSEKYDTIILSDVLEHIPEPQRLWKEMARVLRCEGRIIMNVPFFYWLHEHPHDYYRYTEYALRRFAENAGLEILELKIIGGAPEIITDIFAKNTLPIPIIGRYMAQFSQWFTGLIISTRLGQKMSRATAKNFPYGYFVIAQKPK